ncbi:MAG: ribonuclease P protein component [Acidobacteriota bacterium]|jgi:ribonuclease P protein component|nr:ribonuclease P protein component [Acidobacteriota bacterium]
MTVRDKAQGARTLSDRCPITDEIPADGAVNAARRGCSPAQAFNRRLTGAASEKFPRSIRIVHSSDYKALYKTERKIYSSHFVLYSRVNTLGRSRLGITASRKVGGAVVRNRVKRLFREIFRRHLNQIPDRFDIVVNAKSGCGGAGYEDLRAEFLTAVKKLVARHSG